MSESKKQRITPQVIDLTSSSTTTTPPIQKVIGKETAHLDSKNISVASDDDHHTVSVIGLDNVIVVRTKDATLVCRADMAERVKEIAANVPPSLQ